MSPLRYPGSKRKMLPAIRQLIEANIPRPKLFVEPFAGGASIALGLLELDAVDQVLIGDYDPLVSAFWHEAATNGPRLIDDMMAEPVTLARWDHWRGTTPVLRRWLAVKCLFLNRTTYNGILGGSSAGPIGGRAQTSAYGIDCRFTKATVAAQVRNIYDLAQAGRLIARAEPSSWQSTLSAASALAAERGLARNQVLVYADPPYMEKAARIYGESFGQREHRLLAEGLAVSEARWILSYDDEPLVRDLYRDMTGVREYAATHHYTMHGAGRRQPVPGREVIFTNLPTDPTAFQA